MNATKIMRQVQADGFKIEQAVAAQFNTFVVASKEIPVPNYAWLLPVIIASIVLAVALFVGTVVTFIIIIICIKRKQAQEQGFAQLRERSLSEKLINTPIEMNNPEEKHNTPSFDIDKSLFEIPFAELKNLTEIGSGGSGAIGML